MNEHNKTDSQVQRTNEWLSLGEGREEVQTTLGVKNYKLLRVK